MDNITEEEKLKPTDSLVLEHSLERNVIWFLLFLLISIVGAVGNLVVIWIVLTTKRMRSVTNLFVVNLAVADAMVAILNTTFAGSYNILGFCQFGEKFCDTSEFIGTTSICVSAFTLLAIAIERYLVIMKPLKPRMGKRTTAVIVITIWPVAAAISTYPLFYGVDNGHIIYEIIFMILIYFVPLITMAVLYFYIGRELWGSKAIGEDTNQQVKKIQKKRRVVTMLIVVVSIFAVCWLPFHIYFIIQAIYPDIKLIPAVDESSLFIFWIAMSNSMYNPIIYCWLNERYRDGFKRAFSCCPFVKADNSEHFTKVDRLLPERSTSEKNTTILIRKQ